MKNQNTTVDDIRAILNVSAMQVYMAIYSGALPPPDENGEWELQHIEPFLKNWKERIERRNKK